MFVYYTRVDSGAPGGCVEPGEPLHACRGNDDRRRSSELVLLDDISSHAGNHNGGDLDIGSDGFLYVSVGDAGSDPRGDPARPAATTPARTFSLLNGKILRITLDGQPAPGNPFTGPARRRARRAATRRRRRRRSCQEIFAYGLRNPYRFAFDRNDGSIAFFINDVGQGTYEEVDLGQLGANYGWPIREGGCPQGDTGPVPGPGRRGLTDPITDYGRGDGQYDHRRSVRPERAVARRSTTARYLFGDGGSGDIWVRHADGSSTTAPRSPPVPAADRHDVRLRRRRPDGPVLRPDRRRRCA